MDPQAGARVSHYQLIRKLGSGGMGDVYLADDLQLGRAVAIKFLNAPTDVRARQRLLNEARAVASLDHPVICGVHEVGSDPVRGDFIVMQYVEGDTLAAAIARGPLSREQALAIAADIADALAVAHRHGIVHRDLKPQNIVLQPSGRAKLLDFGIAKRVTSEQQDADADTHTPLTRPHAMIGTPSYMSPEQVKGERADGRSDLFSLGCVLYECLTGRRAFTGGTSGEVYGRILHTDPPPISSLTDRVEPDLEALVTRLLRKSPGDRFQTASEVVGAIATLRGRSNSSDSGYRITPRPPRTAPRSFFVVAAALLVVVAAVGIWWRSGALPKPPDDARGWYEQGVEALRNGAYSTARTTLQRAVDLFPDYAFAYLRLADACTELDDEAGANEALHRATALGNRWRLPREERRRLDAVRWSVLRDHAQAIATYEELLADRPNDAGLWVDAGRAEEARAHNDRALERYTKAVQLDPQNAAAHMRLGSALGRAGKNQEGIAALEQSILLYRAAGRIEGEAEAFIRKAERHSTTGNNAHARHSLQRAVAITGDDRYLSKRLRARFLLSRLSLIEGHIADAESVARDAVEQALKFGLDRDAAGGLVELSNALAGRAAFAEADDALNRSIDLAGRKGARVTEMRARLQQAFLRVQQKRPQEGVPLAESAYRFASEGQYRNLLTQARSVLSRVYDALFRYEEALKLAAEGLKSAEADSNPSLIGESLENTAGVLQMTGRLPEALTDLRRAEQIHRERQLHGSLRFDLPNLAELLLRLNRREPARQLLDELGQLIETNPVYRTQATRLAMLELFEAAIAGQLMEVEQRATALADDSNPKPGSTAVYGRVMREYARAMRGRSREHLSTIVGWAADASFPSFEERPFWVARILLSRNAPAAALAVIEAALESPAVQQNPELRWRLAVLADRAIRAGAAPTTPRDYRAIAEEDRKRLDAVWGGDATTYFARADLAELHGS